MISSVELGKKEFTGIDLPEPFRSVLGKLPPNFSLAIWGPAGSGKSTVAVDLAWVLANTLGKGIYCSSEEGAGPSMQNKFKRLNAEHPDLYVKDFDGMEDLKSAIKYGKATFCIFDSASMSHIKVSEMEDIHGFCKKAGVAFIYILHATKTGDFKGNTFLIHMPDTVLKVEDGVAKTTKNRFADTPQEFDVRFEAKERENHNLYSVRQNPSLPIVKVDSSLLAGKTLKELQKNAEVYAKNNFLPSTITNEDQNIKIILRWRGIKRAVNKRSPKYKIYTIPYVPEFIEKGLLTEVETDRKKRPDIKRILKLESLAEIDKKLYSVVLVIRETSEGKLYYDHTVVEKIKKPAGISGRASQKEKLPNRPSAGQKPDGISGNSPVRKNMHQPTPGSSKDTKPPVKKEKGRKNVVRIGDLIALTTQKGGSKDVTQGEVYEIKPGGKEFRLKDKYGNKDERWRSISDYKNAKITTPKQPVTRQNSGSKKPSFDRFKRIIDATDSFEKAYEEAQKIKDVPLATSEKFRGKYGPDKKLSPKETFRKFYDDVNRPKTKKTIKKSSKFEVGEKYEARHPGDSELRPVWTVVKRTPKTVTVQHGKETATKKIYNNEDGEFVYPEGRYSKAAVLRAERKVEAVKKSKKPKKKLSNSLVPKSVKSAAKKIEKIKNQRIEITFQDGYMISVLPETDHYQVLLHRPGKDAGNVSSLNVLKDYFPKDKKALTKALNDAFGNIQRQNPAALSYMGITEKITIGDGNQVKELKGNFPTFLSGDKLYIIPKNRVKKVKNKVNDKKAVEAFEEFNNYNASDTDYKIDFPEEKSIAVGTAQKIWYTSDKVIQEGDQKDKTNHYVHDFDAGKRPAVVKGDVLIIGNIEWDARGLLN